MEILIEKLGLDDGSFSWVFSFRDAFPRRFLELGNRIGYSDETDTNNY